jgi:hypothetical protein
MQFKMSGGGLLPLRVRGGELLRRMLLTQKRIMRNISALVESNYRQSDVFVNHYSQMLYQLS